VASSPTQTSSDTNDFETITHDFGNAEGRYVRFAYQGGGRVARLYFMGFSGLTKSDGNSENFACSNIAYSDWDGPDFNNNGCSPTSNTNRNTPLKTLIKGDFKYSIKMDTRICGAGLLLGFVESRGSISNTFTNRVSNTPSGNNVFSYDSQCVGNGYAKTWDGSGNLVSGQPSVNINAGDTVALERIDGAFTIKINDAKAFEYALKNTKDGYVWVGHHNKNQAQCFSNAEFCNVAVTQEKSGVEIDFALNSSSTYEIFAKPLWDTENGRLEISKGVLLQAHGREEHDVSAAQVSFMNEKLQIQLNKRRVYSRDVVYEEAVYEDKKITISFM
jgi:hypothetical protein